MGYQVLARKYRPQKFSDVAGQEHVTRTLLNALSQNRVAHGYIFSGHRGIGKTTIARILAMALNCRTSVGTPERPNHEPCLQCVSCREICSGGSAESGELATHSFDFIEIDAASNRGIDDVRSIRTQASVQPARDKYKIFLLDEAHQITEAAFNAILKTLEEPPEWTIFMMATTEPENIPQTIRSRCQHFSFHAVKFDDILAQLKMISAAEQIEAEDAALALLAEAGDGSMRDALSIMDQAIASAPVENDHPLLSSEQIRELMGTVPNTIFEQLLECVAAGQSAPLMERVNTLLNAGHSPLSLARQLVRYLRNTLMSKLGGEQTELLQISADERARAARTAQLFSEEELTRNLQIVLRTFDDLNYRQEQRLHLELGMLKLIHAQRLLPVEQLLSGLAASRPMPIGSGRAAPVPARSSAPPAPRTPSISPFASESPSAPSPMTAQAARADVPAPAQEALEAPATESTPAPAAAQNGSVPSPELTPPERLENAPDSTSIDSDSLRAAVVAALTEGGHASAGQLLGTAAFVTSGSSLRIEVPGVGKKMLGVMVNAGAEKILRTELQRLGAPARFMVVPGEGAASAAAAAAPPPAGSVHEAALANPLVQRAKEIFHAEIRSVVDLHQR
ncbi:MAG TPA: DNA polymerase III subunit gamma/tau [Terracidiphilus sp.]